MTKAVKYLIIFLVSLFVVFVSLDFTCHQFSKYKGSVRADSCKDTAPFFCKTKHKVPFNKSAQDYIGCAFGL